MDPRRTLSKASQPYLIDHSIPATTSSDLFPWATDHPRRSLSSEHVPGQRTRLHTNHHDALRALPPRRSISHEEPPISASRGGALSMITTAGGVPRSSISSASDQSRLPFQPEPQSRRKSTTSTASASLASAVPPVPQYPFPSSRYPSNATSQSNFQARTALPESARRTSATASASRRSSSARRSPFDAPGNGLPPSPLTSSPTAGGGTPQTKYDIKRMLSKGPPPPPSTSVGSSSYGMLSTPQTDDVLFGSVDWSGKEWDAEGKQSPTTMLPPRSPITHDLRYSPTTAYSTTSIRSRVDSTHATPSKSHSTPETSFRSTSGLAIIPPPRKVSAGAPPSPSHTLNSYATSSVSEPLTDTSAFTRPPRLDISGHQNPSPPPPRALTPASAIAFAYQQSQLRRPSPSPNPSSSSNRSPGRIGDASEKGRRLTPSSDAADRGFLDPSNPASPVSSSDPHYRNPSSKPFATLHTQTSASRLVAVGHPEHSSRHIDPSNSSNMYNYFPPPPPAPPTSNSTNSSPKLDSGFKSLRRKVSGKFGRRPKMSDTELFEAVTPYYLPPNPLPSPPSVIPPTPTTALTVTYSANGGGSGSQSGSSTPAAPFDFSDDAGDGERVDIARGRPSNRRHGSSNQSENTISTMPSSSQHHSLSRRPSDPDEFGYVESPSHVQSLSGTPVREGHEPPKTKTKLKKRASKGDVLKDDSAQGSGGQSSSGGGMSFWKLVKKFSTSTLRDKRQTSSDDTIPPVPPIPKHSGSGGGAGQRTSRSSSMSDDYGVVQTSAGYTSRFGGADGFASVGHRDQVVSKPSASPSATKTGGGRSRSGTSATIASSAYTTSSSLAGGVATPPMPMGLPRSIKASSTSSVHSPPSHSRPPTIAPSMLSSSPSDIASSKFFTRGGGGDRGASGYPGGSPRTSTSSYITEPYSEMDPPPVPTTKIPLTQYIMPPDEIYSQLSKSYASTISSSATGEVEDVHGHPHLHNKKRTPQQQPQALQSGSSTSLLSSPGSTAVSGHPRSLRRGGGGLDSTGGIKSLPSSPAMLLGEGRRSRSKSKEIETRPPTPPPATSRHSGTKSSSKSIQSKGTPRRKASLTLTLDHDVTASAVSSRYVAVQDDPPPLDPRAAAAAALSGYGHHTPGRFEISAGGSKREGKRGFLRSKSQPDLPYLEGLKGANMPLESPVLFGPPTGRTMALKTADTAQSGLSADMKRISSSGGHSPSARWSVDEPRKRESDASAKRVIMSRAYSIDSPSAAAAAAASSAAMARVAFRELKASMNMPRKTDDEKAKMWDMLLERSEKAGGTLKATIDSSY